jgi:phosphoserine phosphatase RsbU/P
VNQIRALVADDDRGTALALAKALERWNLKVVVAHDGGAAWDLIRGDSAPSLAVLDWDMPALDGVELCRRVRQDPSHAHMYLILLTARDGRADRIAGLDAGADDYVSKPFDPEELRARINAGVRVITLQERLAGHVAELEAALLNVKQLSGLLPICSYCKRIRTDEDYWQQVDSYVSEHSDARFTHGICPPCYEKVLAELDG